MILFIFFLGFIFMPSRMTRKRRIVFANSCYRGGREGGREEGREGGREGRRGGREVGRGGEGGREGGRE